MERQQISNNSTVNTITEHGESTLPVEVVREQTIVKNYQSSFDANIEAFEKLKSLVDYLGSSEVFAKPFYIKDEEGNVVKDEITKRPLVNKADMAICLMIGRDLGLNPAGSLLLGSKLNERTYLAILKGRALGLDPTTSMEKIVSIPTKNGLVSYTMIDVVSAKLNQGGVDFLPFIKQYAPFYEYFDALTKDELALDDVLDELDNIKSDCYLVDSTSTQDTIKQAKDSGKRLIYRKRHGYYNKIYMKRTYPNGRVQAMYYRFSTVDAERAGLLPIFETKDNKVIQITDGKDNWIKATPQMFNNRTIMIPARIIAADLIHGIYTEDEIQDLIQ